MTTNKPLPQLSDSDGTLIYNESLIHGKNILDILGNPGNNKYLVIFAADANIVTYEDFTLTVTLK